MNTPTRVSNWTLATDKHTPLTLTPPRILAEAETAVQRCKGEK